MSDRKSFTQAVTDYLTARPGVYISAGTLGRIGGRCAWRTRVSESRLNLQAEKRGTIKNKQTRARLSGRWCVLSFYAFVPSPAEEWEPVQVGDAVQVGLL